MKKIDVEQSNCRQMGVKDRVKKKNEEIRNICKKEIHYSDIIWVQIWCYDLFIKMCVLTGGFYAYVCACVYEYAFAWTFVSHFRVWIIINCGVFGWWGRVHLLYCSSPPGERCWHFRLQLFKVWSLVTNMFVLIVVVVATLLFLLLFGVVEGGGMGERFFCFLSIFLYGKIGL